MMVIDETEHKTREEMILNWYQEVFPAAASYIRKRGGQLEEAREIFQEVLLIYLEKLMVHGFQPETSNHAYLMGIVKNRWLKYREKCHSEGLEGVDIEGEQDTRPLVQKLFTVLKRSGEKCMEILQSFYFEKLSTRQLADRHGYASERSATVQKYKCLEKVRNEVKQRSLTYEDFFE